MHRCTFCVDSLAEWSKALASGASPQGRGLEPHSYQFCKHAASSSRFVSDARTQGKFEIGALELWSLRRKSWLAVGLGLEPLHAYDEVITP